MTAKPVLLSLFVAVLAVTALTADDKPEASKEAPKPNALKPFKDLAGVWIGHEMKDGKEGKEFRVEYKVTSGGTAVVETSMCGSEHEMITVIHPDGDDSRNIPVRVVFNNYQAVSGVMLPFHIERFVNRTLQLRLDVSNASVQ